MKVKKYLLLLLIMLVSSNIYVDAANLATPFLAGDYPRLAGSMQQVADKFSELGDRRRARRYRNLARHFLTLIDTEQVEPAAGTLMLAATAPVRQLEEVAALFDGDDPRAIIDEIFINYLTALITNDTGLLLQQLLGASFTLPGYARSLNQSQQLAFYSELLATYHFKQLNLSDLYRLESRTIILLDSARAVLTVNSAERSPSQLTHWRYWDGFWNSSHLYFFEFIGGSWQLIGFAIDH
ncbi:MAG: hypothetical protein FWE37_02925 [Spirochaetaceae bacterium]|nr:hypothetical protein [Spirochaetaceae bacterium]